MKTKLSVLLVSILLGVILPLQIRVDPANAKARPIYIVSTWQDYLRLVPLSVRDGYVPLLYSADDRLTAAIQHFAELYDGAPQVLDSQDVERLITGDWSQTIVVTEDKPRLTLLASSIAVALEASLYYDPLPRQTLDQLQARQVIAVGDVTLPDGVATMQLADEIAAMSYYNTLIDGAQVAILIENDEPASLSTCSLTTSHFGTGIRCETAVEERSFFGTST